MKNPFTLITLDSVDSTSRYLKDYVSENQPNSSVFCSTKIQTHGYGQQKRSWVTNQDSAIFSLAYPIEAKSIVPGLVSLHIASLLHESLVELTSDKLYVKWPNDIYNQHGKVAGMLIEQVSLNDYKALIIGIGINRSTENLVDSASYTTPFNTETLLNVLHSKVNQAGLVEFSKDNLMKYWQANDVFATNETVQLISESDNITGLYKGINQHGQAIVMHDGQQTFLSSGQTSIRKQNTVK